MKRRLTRVQRYISAFEYNYTGRTFHRARRGGGMKHLVRTAKAVMKEALPIQCVEAVFLAVYLTDGLGEVRTDGLVEVIR